MHAIELDATVDTLGNLHVPEKYRELYGRQVRLMVLLPEPEAVPRPGKAFDPMKYANTLAWPMDGLAYQKQVRDEWS